jgi:hypothetical protein
MAYVVQRRSGSWELRESRSTPAGPRSRTLASFRTLTPEVIDHPIGRSEDSLTPTAVRQVAARAGAPVGRSGPDAAAAALLAELSEGRTPSSGLRRLLADAISGGGDAPTEAERAAAPWIAATLEAKGEALRDLLLLADRLPVPRRGAAPAFPRIASAER